MSLHLLRCAKDTGLPIAWAYRFRLADKVSALDKLMKHLGLFENDKQQKVDSVSEFLSDIRSRKSRLPLKPPAEL